MKLKKNQIGHIGQHCAVTQISQMESKDQKTKEHLKSLLQTYAVMEMLAADMGLTSFTSMAF